MEITQAPIEHWSHSSLKLFIDDPFAFHQQYVLKIYNNISGPSAVVGSAAHKCLEFYYKSTDRNIDSAIREGQRYIDNQRDANIDYGKTGSREEIVKDYITAVNFYFAEAPSIHEVLEVESSITTFIERDGVTLPIPIKAKADLIERDATGRIVIHDHKFTSQYTDPDKEKAERVMQAMFNFYTVRSKFGEAPYKITFDEVKLSKNKEKSSQLKCYEIYFEGHPEYETIFHQYYADCTEEICRPDKKYIPNYTAKWTGQQSFDTWRAKLMSSDVPSLPVIRHRPMYQGVEIQNQVKYVPSLTDGVDMATLSDEERIRAKLLEFRLPVEMKETYRGHHITKFTMKPSRGVRMSEFEKSAKDLAIALKARSVRVEAPIMGTDLVGVEIPATERKFSPWTPELAVPGTLSVPIGIDVYGETVRKDLAVMPHLLVAGATGSGKSVFLHALIKALTSQNEPSDLRMVLIDPKRVEFSLYKSLPHLEMPPIYDAIKATQVLWALVDEMEDRYTTLEKHGCRNIDEYNSNNSAKMSKMVIVIDELADLMLQKEEAENTVEVAIIRLAQKARASGIHLVLGTQRPSVDVITGLLKANMPARIALSVFSETDSRVILDTGGAEQLVGKGDLLFLDPSTRGLTRLQGFSV